MVFGKGGENATLTGGSGSVHIADVTMFYAPSSGGVRTYLEAKRQRYRQLPDITHTLMVPLTKGAQNTAGIVRIPSPPLPFSNGYRFPLRRKQWVDRLKEIKPSIIEAADPYVTGWASIDAGNALDIPVIGFYHSDLPEMLGSRFGSSVREYLQKYVHRLYQHYERVLAPSHEMATKLVDMGVKNVHVQPLGVDSHLYNPDKRDPAIRQKLGLTDETRLLIFAGRGSHEKNLPELLSTMRLLGSEYHLLMIGSNMPTHLPHNVTTIDHFVPQSELARYLASADALVHAGTNETFGLVVLEGMASGLPVVVSRAGALKENVNESFGMLSDPHDPVSMAHSVHALFERDTLALGKRARQEVEQRFDWSAVVTGVLGHYEQALGITLPQKPDEVSIQVP